MMTEAEWLTAADPARMLRFLHIGEVSDRKLQLLAVALLRHGTVKLTQKIQLRHEQAELFADGASSIRDLRKHWGGNPWPARPAEWVEAIVTGERGESKPIASPMQMVSFIHEIFGNPFHPITISPDWLTSSVLELARQMHDRHNFVPMTVLAEALQDAGCDNDDLLDHLRGPSPHVKGCWALDLVLGKR